MPNLRPGEQPELAGIWVREGFGGDTPNGRLGEDKIKVLNRRMFYHPGLFDISATQSMQGMRPSRLQRHAAMIAPL
jgi:hypothetical protein